MSRLVVKFGGTSLADIACIARAADTIVSLRKQGHECAVVLSAMGRTTDHLCDQAHALADEPDARELDALLVNGEHISVALMAVALRQRGCPARSVYGHQSGIEVSGPNGAARIRHIERSPYETWLAEGTIPVVAGFQGMAEDGDIRTIGRGGSDLSAVALAVALEADECRIYTDVDGVHTADPRLVADAALVRQITFEEMLELASLGAKVVQSRAVELAGRHRMPLRICSSFHDDPGTLINYEVEKMEQATISGITHQAQQAMISVVGLPADHDVVASLMERLVEAQVQVDMVVQTQRAETVDISFSLPRSQAQSAQVLLQDYCRYLDGVEILCQESVAKLSVVGVGLRSHGAVASKILRTLAELRITPLMISTSEIKFSVLVDEKFVELGVRELHEAFAAEKSFEPVAK